ncbi:hypothetical protein ACFWJW_03940 [Streptomyces sp. NPDC127097]|uniref:hypothetical protein n=1 Tax=Streptomyces sp. NPDC127097 TaxID=3347136 RepID=UPI00365AFE74
MKRAIAVAVAGLSLAAGSLALASPAEASASQCQTYLKQKGYVVGPKVKAHCKTGAYGGSLNRLACTVRLIGIDVKERHASTACRLADD